MFLQLKFCPELSPVLLIYCCLTNDPRLRDLNNSFLLDSVCGQESGCSPAGFCGSDSQAAARHWPGPWAPQGSRGAGLRPGRVGGSGQHSAPDWQLAGGAQFLATWASPAWQPAPSKRAAERACEKEEGRETCVNKPATERDCQQGGVTVVCTLGSGVTSLVLADSSSLEASLYVKPTDKGRGSHRA